MGGGGGGVYPDCLAQQKVGWPGEKYPLTKLFNIIIVNEN